MTVTTGQLPIIAVATVYVMKFSDVCINKANRHQFPFTWTILQTFIIKPFLVIQ